MPLHLPTTMLALATMAGAAAAAQPCTRPLPGVAGTAANHAAATATNTALNPAAHPAANPAENAAAAPAATDTARDTAPGRAASLARYRLINQQCPGLAEPGTARAAEQLLMFDRATTVALALPGAATPATLAMAPAPREQAPLNAAGERIVALAPGVIEAARAHGLDPLLLHAIAHVESRHNPQAVSPAGARGLMQVMPATAQRFGVANPERTLHDADTNLRASAALLRTLQKRYGADLRLVLAAYNAGEGAVAKHGNDVPPYPETQAYVRDVSAIYRRLKDEFGVASNGTLLALKRED